MLTRMAFYNDTDAAAAAWLRRLGADARIPKGTVEETGIADLARARIESNADSVDDVPDGDDAQPQLLP